MSDETRVAHDVYATIKKIVMECIDEAQSNWICQRCGVMEEGEREQQRAAGLPPCQWAHDSRPANHDTHPPLFSAQEIADMLYASLGRTSGASGWQSQYVEGKEHMEAPGHSAPSHPPPLPLGVDLERAWQKTQDAFKHILREQKSPTSRRNSIDELFDSLSNRKGGLAVGDAASTSQTEVTVNGRKKKPLSEARRLARRTASKVERPDMVPPPIGAARRKMKKELVEKKKKEEKMKEGAVVEKDEDEEKEDRQQQVMSQLMKKVKEEVPEEDGEESTQVLSKLHGGVKQEALEHVHVHPAEVAVEGEMQNSSEGVRRIVRRQTRKRMLGGLMLEMEDDEEEEGQKTVRVKREPTEVLSQPMQHESEDVQVLRTDRSLTEEEVREKARLVAARRMSREVRMLGGDFWSGTSEGRRTRSGSKRTGGAGEGKGEEGNSADFVPKKKAKVEETAKVDKKVQTVEQKQARKREYDRMRRQKAREEKERLKKEMEAGKGDESVEKEEGQEDKGLEGEEEADTARQMAAAAMKERRRLSHNEYNRRWRLSKKTREAATNKETPAEQRAGETSGGGGGEASGGGGGVQGAARAVDSREMEWWEEQLEAAGVRTGPFLIDDVARPDIAYSIMLSLMETLGQGSQNCGDKEQAGEQQQAGEEGRTGTECVQDPNRPGCSHWMKMPKRPQASSVGQAKRGRVPFALNELPRPALHALFSHLDSKTRECLSQCSREMHDVCAEYKDTPLLDSQPLILTCSEHGTQVAVSVCVSGEEREVRVSAAEWAALPATALYPATLVRALDGLMAARGRCITEVHFWGRPPQDDDSASQLPDYLLPSLVSQMARMPSLRTVFLQNVNFLPARKYAGCADVMQSLAYEVDDEYSLLAALERDALLPKCKNARKLSFGKSETTFRELGKMGGWLSRQHIHTRHIVFRLSAITALPKVNVLAAHCDRLSLRMNMRELSWAADLNTQLPRSRQKVIKAFRNIGQIDNISHLCIYSIPLETNEELEMWTNIIRNVRASHVMVTPQLLPSGDSEGNTFNALVRPLFTKFIQDTGVSRDNLAVLDLV